MLGQSGHVLHLAVAGAVAMALFRGAHLWHELRLHDDILTPSRLWWAFLLGHVVAFAVFATITALILGDQSGRSIHQPGGGVASVPTLIEPTWFLAWAVTGATTLVLWCAAVLPPRSWLPLARLAGGAVLIGTIVGSLAWFAGQLTSLLWRPLSLGTFSTVSLMLHLAGLDVVSQPEQFVIGTPGFLVQIAPECSGYEGIGLIWVFLSAYLWLFRREIRFPVVFMLFPIGTVVIWLANSARIAARVIVGTYGSRAVAVSGFHSQAGWLGFNAVALGLVLWSHRLRSFRVDVDSREERTESNPAAAYLGPMMALLATMMLTGDFSAGFDRLYHLRIVIAAVVLWHYRRTYTDLRPTWSWGALAIGALVFAICLALEPSSTAVNPLKNWVTGLPASWLAIRVAGSTVVVPLAEELAFRSFIIRRIVSAEFTQTEPVRFTWGSFLISSILFGALHGRWLAGTLAGLLYALALYRRRELSDAVLAHATTNALIAAYVLATGSWSMWS